MSADFVLTLAAPKEHGLETFDTDASIWSATDTGKISIGRYTGDSIRDSVMKIQGPSWTLSDGKTLGDGIYLSDSHTGMGEGAYKDFTVTAGIRYAFSCLHKMSVGTLTIQLHDQINDTTISSVNRTGTIWKSYETSIVAPAGCSIIRVKFLQSDSDARSGPFYIDNISLNGNVLLHDPDNYSRIPERLGSLHQTLGGRRVYDLRAIHYSLYLGWNVFEEDQYESLREVYYSNELLYFDDGDVPPLIKSEKVYETAEYSYEGIVNPSDTHKAYSDSSSSLPSSKSDFETTEFSTTDYEAINGDDTSYKETANPSSGEYLYHKLLLLSSIDRDGVKRFRVKVKMSSSDSSPQSLDGGLLYAWNGTNWVELARNTNSAITELTYSTAEAEVAMQFVDSDDNYIRLLLRSRNRRDGTNNLSLRTYYVECEINEGLDLTIELSHKAILDSNDDVIWVKNLTKEKTLTHGIDYTIAIDRRSIEMCKSLVFSGDDYIDCGNDTSLQIGGSVSVEVWLYITEAKSSYIVGNYNGKHYLLHADPVGNGVKVKYHIDDGANDSEAQTDVLSLNAWYHILAVRDSGNSVIIYVNGTAGSPVSDTAGDISGSAPMIIGAKAGISSENVEGYMREVRIYGVALTADDASWLATHPRPTAAEIFANTSASQGGGASDDDLVLYHAYYNGNLIDLSEYDNNGTHNAVASYIPGGGDEVEVKYNRYFEVMFASIPEEWFSGDPSSKNRSRSSDIILQTLSESR